MKRLAELFWAFFRISLLVIGGGYAIMAVAERTFAGRAWIREGELVDRLPVFQTIPGLISVHTAVFVGMRRAGAWGAAVAVAAVALPSVAVFAAVSAGYAHIPLQNAWLNSAFVGLRASVAGIVAATVVRSWRRMLDSAWAYALFVLVAGSVGFRLVGVPLALLAAAAAGLARAYAPRVPGAFRSSALPLALLVFLKYGALCVGGGFVLVPMYLRDFVGPEAMWVQLPADEFASVMALTQMTPGPVGVNCATFFGYRLAGLWGAAAASALLLAPGALASYWAQRSLDRWCASRAVTGLMRGIRPASMGLLVVALVAFVHLAVVDGQNFFNPTALVFVIISTMLAMKKNISPILVIVLATLCAAAVRAEEAPPAPPSPSASVPAYAVADETFPDITRERFPDADSVLADSFENNVYTPEGTYSQVSEQWAKVLTDKGRREESTASLSFNRRFGTARFLEVRVISPDGTSRSVDLSTAMRETTDNSSMSANIYDPFSRKVVCTIPGVCVGDTVYVKSERSTFAARVEGTWANMAVMEWACPIVKSTVRVVSPAARPLKRTAVRNALGNCTMDEQVQADGSVVRTWTVTNSPQVFTEPDMPPLYSQVQRVLFSTVEDWPEVSRWYWNVSLPHMEKTNPAITNKVRQIVADLGREASDCEKMSAIYKWVAQEIRYMGLTMEDTAPGFAPHDVCITFDNRYGVCRDKAALLAVMLRIAGLEAYPVLIQQDSAKKDPEVPLPYFNHAIVAVADKRPNAPSKYILMDPTDESSRDLFPAYLGNCSYIVARPDGEQLLTSPVPPAEANCFDVSSVGTLFEDGSMMVETHMDFTGINDNAFRTTLVRKNPAARLKFFEDMLRSRFPGAEMMTCDIEPSNLQDTAHPLKVRTVSRLPDALVRGRTRAELTPPLLTRSVGIANVLLAGRTALEKRRFPLLLNSTAMVREALRVKLGDVVEEAISMPQSLSLADACRFDQKYEIRDGDLVVNRVYAVDSVELSPDQYRRTREDLKRIEAIGREKPVFVRNLLQNANCHYLYETNVTAFTGARSWVTTNRVALKVLTYDGKKRMSELSFGYNPTWKRINLLKASVTSPDGRVHQVTSHEINEMDCGWAARAVRYPASKQLIVNLPSVEIGSLIEYAYEEVVTDAPTGYYDNHFFDVFEPTGELSVRVGDWSRTVRSPKYLVAEPMLAAGVLWRDCVTISSNTFTEAAYRLRPALEVRPIVIDDLPGGATIQDIRDWMARHVVVAGPSLYEVPLGLQLTDPSVVLSEHYASRLDYIRAMVALLKGRGYDASIVFATADAGNGEVLCKYNMFTHPNVGSFSAALCRVRSEGKTFFIGTENEYTPLGACAYEGSHYLDPVTDEFGVVFVPSADLSANPKSETHIVVQADGAVDLSFWREYAGVPAGQFRRTYAEMLPEDRVRHYRELLSRRSHAAEATGGLVTDISSYPSRLAYSCRIPDFAVVRKDEVVLTVPDFVQQLYPMTGVVRRNPIGTLPSGRSLTRYVIDMPEGYDVIERLPDGYTLSNPLKTSERWCENRVTSEVVNGRVRVVIERETFDAAAAFLPAGYFALLKDWSRVASCTANRVIAVRKR